MQRHGIGKADASHEPLQSLSLLAVQPAGNLYVFPVPPASAQYASASDFPKRTAELTAAIQSQLASIKTHLVAFNKKAGAGLAVKVVFVLERDAVEKDLDNMLKWFLDCFKRAGADDAVIADLRAMKWRRSDDGPGMIGLSVASCDYRRGDAQLSRALAVVQSKGLSPTEVGDCLEIVEHIQTCIDARVSQ